MRWPARCGAWGCRPLPGARTVVVGDDPALEMRLAKNSGAMGIAVTTGILDRAALSLADPQERPDAVLDSLEPIIEALG